MNVWNSFQRPTEAHGYADDILDINTGIDEQTIADNLQRDLKKLEDWAETHSLSFNVDKTKVMVFTKKKKHKLPTLTLHGKELEYVQEFKYLGITIDNKLTWKPHINNQINKATRAMMMARKMTGKRWGLKPRNMEWIYTSIVCPILSYGSIAWLPKTNGKGIQKQLEKVQRKACLMITRGIQSTPTAGMEAILGLPPLHIYCKGIALNSYIRIEKYGQCRPSKGEILGKNTYQAHSRADSSVARPGTTDKQTHTKDLLGQ